jgi:hypothetical protein
MYDDARNHEREDSKIVIMFQITSIYIRFNYFDPGHIFVVIDSHIAGNL